MTSGIAAASEFSKVGIGIETTSRTYVAPTAWLSAESHTLNFSPDKIEKPVLAGNALANRLKAIGKTQYSGQIQTVAMATNGAKLWLPGMGADAYTAALTADAVKATTSIVTSAGISTITLENTTSLTYTVGKVLRVGTSTASEWRTIETVTGNGAPGTVVTVGSLVGNAAAAAGTVVQQEQCHLLSSNPTSNALPTFSIEDNEGNQFAEHIAGNFIEQWVLKAGKDSIDLTWDYYSTVGPDDTQYSPTTPTMSAAELADETYFFTSLHDWIVTSSDAAQMTDGAVASGVSAPGRNLFITDVTITYKNALAKFPTHDLGSAYRATRGPVSMEVEYTYVNVSGRHSEFKDMLRANKGKVVPFTYGMANNQAQSGAAVGRALSVHVPALKIMDYSAVRQVGNVLMSTVKGSAVPTGQATDLCNVCLVNADLTAYA